MAKIQTPRPVRGTQDLLGDAADRFTHVVETFERVRKLYGFRRIETPVFEQTAVFSRSLGETTDVVSKEMYTFEDRGGDSLTLRPEFTAGICRAYITEGWQQYAPLKVATHGALFRYERPQKGRYRQFHQIDAEIIGAAEPLADAELMIFADQLMKELGISEKVVINLNTLGDAATRDAWRAALLEHFSSHRDKLSEDSLRRLEANPLRILDSKDPQDRPIADSAPEIDDFLTAEASDFFDAVKAGLDAAGVAYQRNSRLVRGLDYYRHTAFELISTHLGAQAAAGGGGRYDGLIEALGGPPTPAVGWALGIDRLAMLLDAAPETMLDAIIAVEDDGALHAAIQALGALRNAGLSADVVASGSPRKRFDKAAKIPARALVSVTIRDDQPSFNIRGDTPEQVKSVLGILTS
jgi:histidyl-tRNA synthetase